MLLGFIPYYSTAGEVRSLCLLASKPDQNSKPLRIDLIEPSSCGVYFVSNVEGVVATWDEREQAKVLCALPPAVMYLTPDTAERPGFSTVKLRIRHTGEDNYQIEFARKMEDAWQRWDATSLAR